MLLYLGKEDPIIIKLEVVLIGETPGDEEDNNSHAHVTRRRSPHM
jgi:hypothetical protein